MMSLPPLYSKDLSAYYLTPVESTSSGTHIGKIHGDGKTISSTERRRKEKDMGPGAPGMYISLAWFPAMLAPSHPLKTHRTSLRADPFVTKFIIEPQLHHTQAMHGLDRLVSRGCICFPSSLFFPPSCSPDQKPSRSVGDTGACFTLPTCSCDGCESGALYTNNA